VLSWSESLRLQERVGYVAHSPLHAVDTGDLVDLSGRGII
jgi:hypothetical protein